VGLALAVRRLSGLTEPKSVGTFALCIGVYNYAYVCLPLAVSLFPGATDTIGVLFAHNLGTEIAMWIFGLLLLHAAPGKSQWKQVLNAPVATILIAVPLNYFGAEQWIPGPVLATAKMLGQCALPLGLILVGATAADYLREFRATPGWRLILVSCLLRLGLLPALFLCIAKFLPCTVELKRVIIMQSGMAAAIFPIIMCKHYGGSPSVAVRIVIGTSIVSFLTMPLWVRLGMRFAGI
jgi:predicted permease